ncbi:MAG: nitroreductase family protein [Deltaproteobacteria bacterium]|jgi:hypothetical protein|nr:nitroreductase family protein [Deltaproteobacteria bacterium]
MKRRTFIALGAGAAVGALGLKAGQALGAAAPEPLAKMPTGETPAFVPMPDTAMSPGRRMLPIPDRMGGLPLLQTLAQRRSTRRFSALGVTDNVLANLLWATWGVNRADGKRTAPTAMNKQPVDLHVALANGIWLYHARENQLELQNQQDVRGRLGKGQVVLIYTADAGDYGAMAVGSLYQNAGLYCASVGLGNVVRASNAKEAGKYIKITPGYKIWVTQDIGWPA